MVAVLNFFGVTIFHSLFFSGTARDFSSNRLGVLSAVIGPLVALANVNAPGLNFIAKNIPSGESHLLAGNGGFGLAEIFVADGPPFSVRKVLQSPSLGVLVVLSDSNSSFIGLKGGVEVLECAFHNNVFVVLALPGRNIPVALVELGVVFPALDTLEIHGLEIGSAVILTSVVRAGLRVFFVIHKHPVGVLHHSADGPCRVVVHSLLTSRSPEPVISELKPSETVQLALAVHDSDIALDQIDVVNSESCKRFHSVSERFDLEVERRGGLGAFLVLAQSA